MARIHVSEQIYIYIGEGSSWQDMKAFISIVIVFILIFHLVLSSKIV